MRNGDIVRIDSARLVNIFVQRDGEWIAGTVLVERGGGPIDSGRLSVSGILPGAELDRFYRLELRYQPHPRYGDQFRILKAQAALPMSEVGLASYLKHHIHGVGPKRAAELIRCYGVELPAVLADEHAVQRLRREAGLPHKVAEALVTEWRQVQESAELTIALHGAGCSPTQIARMHDRFGDDLARVAAEEPYLLMVVRGIAFKQADCIARHFGCDPQGPLRCLAAIGEVLRRETQQGGHCWTAWPQVCDDAAALLELPVERFATIVATAATVELADQFLQRDSQDRLWLPHLWRAHQVLVRALAQRLPMSLRVPAPHSGVPVTGALVLTDEQEAAVAGALGRSIAIITGGPGTGKTTVVRNLIEAYEARFDKPVIRLAAPTGKAAKRMTESCGRPASTIHRLLEWQSGGPQRNLDKPIEADLLIVDEASMLDLELAAYLLQSLPAACRLVLVGDVDQLPSVGPGQVLADCIAAGVATYRLTQVQRQAQESLIIAAAGSIKAGERPRFARDRQGDCYHIDEADRTRVREKILRFLQRDIPQRRGIPPADIRVLIPQYSGECGIDAVNQLLQAALNPPAPGKPEILIGKDQVLRAGDRLLWLSNQPDLGLVNGNELLLRKIAIDGDKRYVQLVDDDGALHDLAAHQLDVRLAYAMSVHKAQGSEYPACIVVLDPAAGRLLTRRMFYTAIPRAKRFCIVLGEGRLIGQAIANNRDDGRRSGLAEDLGVAVAAG